MAMAKLCWHRWKTDLIYYIKRRSLYSLTGVWEEDPSVNEIRTLENYWRDKINEPVLKSQKKDRETMYIVPMFPYPSGTLHMGHIRVYTISDTLTRFNVLADKRVLHTIGWDSFGLPAENAAKINNRQPAEWTDENISHMKKQLKLLNCSFDWSREIVTSDSNYYKWTQYIFLKMLEKGLAYHKPSLVNWDPVDQTVLADEQIDADGKSWRSGAKVEKKLMKQWFLKTTKFATSLYDGLSDPSLKDWSHVINRQRGWIGKCDGWNFDFMLEREADANDWLTVWTDSPEFLCGAAFVALAPDHYLCVSENIRYNGEDVLLKIKAINPFNGDKLPIIVTNKVTFPFEANVSIGIPPGTKQEVEFCRKHNLRYKNIIDDSGCLINSSKFTGMDQMSARTAMCRHAEDKKFGGHKCSSKLRDWLISRQRYWGTPIPVIHCESCKVVPVSYDNLPVLLPACKDVFTSGSASPLARAKDWHNVKCPKCGSNARRETDTMDTFVDSSWYFLRYLDPDNEKFPFCAEEAFKYMPVDLYIGGIEHAVLHLYYARFVMHFLHNEGLVHCREPFKRLLMTGRIRAKTFVNEKTRQYLPQEQVAKKGKEWIEKGTKEPVCMSWDKMSKSKFNGLDPQELFDKYGIDIVRLVILICADSNVQIDWSDGVEQRFKSMAALQKKLWKFVHKFLRPRGEFETLQKFKYLPETDKMLRNKRNEIIKMMTFGMRYSLNVNEGLTAIHHFLKSLKSYPSEAIGWSFEFERMLEDLIIMLAPCAPHLCSELWAGFCNSPNLYYPRKKSLWEQSWPDVEWNFPLKIIISINNKEVAESILPRNTLEPLSDVDIVKKAKLELIDRLTSDVYIRDVDCVRPFGCDIRVNFVVDMSKTSKTKTIELPDESAFSSLKNR